LNAEEREQKSHAQQSELKIQETFSLETSSMNNSERGLLVYQELQHEKYTCHYRHKWNSKQQLNQNNKWIKNM